MTATKNSLRVSKHIRAKRDKVFQAWTHPDLMKKWFCPKDMTPGAVEVDLRVGGSYRGTMIGRDSVHTAVGTYREIVPNEKLVFTHGWEGPDRVETRVTVEFSDQDGGTQVVLTHEKFTDIEQAKGHEAGWMSTLDNLAAQFA